MDTLNQLLRAVITNPEADDPRLQFADVLQESGEEQWAGFIREQVRRATYERTDGYSRTPKSVELELWTGLLHKFNLPSNWLVSFRIDDPNDWGEDWCVCIHRGFVAQLTCTAAEFLEHADGLIWHPEQKIQCPECEGRGMIEYDDHRGVINHYLCRACAEGRTGYRRGVGQILRPCPDTAQPITKVILSTFPTAEVVEFNNLRNWKKRLEWGGDVRDSLKAEWPGIEFTFPDLQ